MEPGEEKQSLKSIQYHVKRLGAHFKPVVIGESQDDHCFMVENLNERYIASVTGLDSYGRSYWPHGAILFPLTRTGHY